MERERLLVIRLSALGDVVLATGWFRALRERHPRAHLALMTKGAFADFARAMGVFDEIVVDNRPHWDVADWRRICRDVLAEGRWDAVYDLQWNGRVLCRTNRYRLLATLLARRPMRWGRRAGDGFDFLVTPAKPPFVWRRARVEHVPFPEPPPDLSFCHGGHAHFDLLPPRYALLIPGCSPGHPYKKWPAASYRALSERLGARGVESVVMGTTSEADDIAAIVRANPYAVDFMGLSALADIPDLARGAVFVVGNDTGPSHMARIAGARTVTLFCARTRNSARPGARAANLVRETIGEISVDDVLAAAAALGAEGLAETVP